MHVLETDRLVLRPYEAQDAARVLDIHSRPEVVQWLGNPPHVPMADLETALEWIDVRRRREQRDPLDLTMGRRLRSRQRREHFTLALGERQWRG